MRARAFLCAIALAVALCGAVDRAAAAVYWSNGSSLGRVNLDGSEAFWPLPSGYSPAPEARGACGLAVDAQHLYWGDASGGAIGRSALDASSSNGAFITGLGAPCGVAVTGTHIYWSDWGSNLIGRANLDGTGVQTGFVGGAANPCGIAVDGSHVYWANQIEGSIGRADLDGGNVDQRFITGAGNPCGVAVGGGHVYWGDQDLGSIGRAAVDGSGVLPRLVTGAGEPWDVAVTGGHVLWADRWGTAADPNGGIGRAGTDGSMVNHDLVPGIHNPTGVAADSLVLAQPLPAPRQSDFLRFGKLTHKRDGSLRLVVVVPARGELELKSPRIGWHLDKGSPPPYVAGSFRWKLKLWPGKRGRAARNIRRQLHRRGRAPILLRVAYTQEGRTPLEATKRLAFRAKR
jgi:hypothetical protein